MGTASAARASLGPGATLDAAAQDVPKPDFGKWEQVAQQAETVVADGSSNLERLTAIRQQVFDWRRTFQQAQNVNGANWSVDGGWTAQ